MSENLIDKLYFYGFNSIWYIGACAGGIFGGFKRHAWQIRGSYVRFL